MVAALAGALSASLLGLSIIDDSSLLQSPQEMAIFQRDLSSHAQTIKFELKRASAEVTHVQLIVYADKSYLSDSDVPANDATFTLQSEAIPQGGWYRAELIQLNRDNTRAVRTTLDKVGVGDVYIVAGQSNAADWAETMTKSGRNDTVMFDPEQKTWAPLADPQPLTNGWAGSVWPEAIDLVAAKENIPVGIVNTSIGGTLIEQWQPGQKSNEGLELFNRLVTTAEALRELSGFRMVLWHQGESDVGLDATYRQNFLNLMAEFDRAVGGEPSKWMVSVATFIPPDDQAADCGTPPEPPGGDALRLVQQQLPDGVRIFRGPDGDDLRGRGFRYPGALGMCVHFAAAAQTEMARRWANAIEALP